MTPFIIVGTQRTGSTLLVSNLDAHPDITCYSEVFVTRVRKPHSFSTFRDSRISRQLGYFVVRPRLVAQYLDWLYGQAPTKAAGFKILYSHLGWLPYRFPSVLEYAERKGCRIIRIARLNLLKTVVSRARASKTGVFHSTRPVTSTGIKIDPDRLIQSLDALKALEESWARRLARLSTPVLTVSYEDITARPAVSASELYDFLEVAQGFPFKNALVKLTPNDLSSAIINFDEVAALLKDTEYEYLLTAE